MIFYAKFVEIKKTIDKKEIKVLQGSKTVLEHCIDVGVLSKVLLSSETYLNVLSYLSNSLGIPSSDVLKFIPLLFSLHDIGKVHPYFQAYDPANLSYMKGNNLISTQEFLGLSQLANGAKISNSEYRIRHEVVSKRLLLSYYGVKSRVFKSIIEVLSLHHEKNNISDMLKKSNNLYWDIEANKIINELEVIFDYSLTDLDYENILNIDSVCFTLLGLLEFCDWVASSKYFGATLNSSIDTVSLCSYIDRQTELSIEVLSTNLGQLDLLQKFDGSFSNLFATENYTLRGIQESIINLVENKDKKFVLIEGPMGEGKTEAGLYSAFKAPFNKNGFYFALPTSATSDSMYSRIEKIFKRQNITSLNLLHSNVIMDKLYLKGTDDFYSFLSSSNTGLFVQNAVGTIDQVLLSVIKNKFSNLRLLGLINKVLIVDEIHAYDLYMSTILFTLLSWANSLSIPVVLLSATLPINKRRQLLEAYTGETIEKPLNEGYPLITTVDIDNNIVETVVKEVTKTKDFEYCILKEKKQFLDLVDVKIREGLNVGIICNTVKESQWLYTYFLTSGITNIVCLNSLFKVKDRKVNELNVISSLGSENRAVGLLIIGTQVLEQSLDIDFDLLFSYLCPIDLLYQRIGRFGRFDIKGRDLEKYVYVVLDDESFKISKYVYHPLLLERTKAWVLGNISCSLPLDFRKGIEYVYNKNIATEEEEELVVSYVTQQGVEQDLGEIASFTKFNPLVFQRLKLEKEYNTILDTDSFYGTRLGSNTIKVILISKNKITEIGKENFKNCEDIRIYKNLMGDVVQLRTQLLTNDVLDAIINNETDFFFMGGKMLKHYLIIGTSEKEDYSFVSLNGVDLKYSNRCGLQIEK